MSSRTARGACYNDCMKKPERPLEHACPACEGTGLTTTKPSTRLGVRIYPPSCKACEGKGKIAD
jgi:DnaJ-class molecular chaperone